jgi:hypothetical protein
LTTHVKVIGTAFIVLGVLSAGLAVFSSIAMTALAGYVATSDDSAAPAGAAILGFAGIAVTAALLAYAIPAILCGIGLLRFKRWARILGIVLAVVSLIRIPLGTVFGVYALIVLFNRKTEALFGLPDEEALTL